MNRTDLEHLKQIVTGAQKIIDFSAEIHSAEDLKSHSIAGDAIILNFVSIMDAVKKTSPEIRAEIKMINWEEFCTLEKEIADIRFGFNMDLSFEIIKNKLPDLLLILTNYLNKNELL
jgi:uncharacterized protein with HEPN domain